MPGKLFFAYAALAAASLMILLPANAAEAPLFVLERPAVQNAPQHALDSRTNFKLDAGKLSRLSKGENLYVELPDQRILRARVARLNEIMRGTSGRHTVLSIDGGRGSIEIRQDDQGVRSVRISDIRDTIQVYVAELGADGLGELVRQDANDYYCIEMPTEVQAPASSQSAQAVFLAGTPELAQLQTLQSKPNANKVLYLNYWGGVLSDTRWNDEYTDGADIVYSPYSSDADSSIFSSEDMDRMWLGWREVVEDYAPFDVNVTTDPAVYAAMPSADRSMIIATTSYDWFGSEVGGVANFGSFGNDYSGVGWAWNKTLGAFGQTMAHEAGHQMGLHHDGQGQFTEYYTGHGANDEWGPIMGAPFNQTYVQWSKGEYPNANNFEDDLTIIESTLGADADIIGEDFASAFEVSSSSYVEGRIEPQGLLMGMDTDVYRFDLAASQNVSIRIAPVLSNDTQRVGSNLSLYARLTDGLADPAESSQLPPHFPQDNVLSFDGLLGPGSYYLVITALSPDISWSTGFGEYDNAGLYAVSLSSDLNAPDLTSQLSVEDSEVFSGQSLGISAEVRNIGVADAAAGSLRFYRSTDALISPVDTEISVRNTFALGPLQSDFINLQITAPETPVTIYYGACVDPVAGEQLVANNCSIGTPFTVRAVPQDTDIGEAVEQPALDWVRGGDESFYRQTDDSVMQGDAARSGAILDDQLSYIETQVNGPGWLRFSWKVSSEVDFDYFRFVDNAQQVEAISGEVDWSERVYELSAGVHTLQWRYEKDPFTAGGSDAGWLDGLEVAEQKFEILAYDGPQSEGDSGSTIYNFTVGATGVSGTPTSVDYMISGAGSNPASVEDFAGAFPSGTIAFGIGDTSQPIEIIVSGDTMLEPDEGFVLTLSNPQGGILGTQISAQSDILNDDDDDGDGIADKLDNCPLVANPDQLNTDGDFWGNACDGDDDNDKHDDVDDNCPLDANPGQEDICTLCIPIKSASGALSLICL